jgi:hypothetical protein
VRPVKKHRGYSYGHSAGISPGGGFYLWKIRPLLFDAED